MHRDGENRALPSECGRQSSKETGRSSVMPLCAYKILYRVKMTLNGSSSFIQSVDRRSDTHSFHQFIPSFDVDVEVFRSILACFKNYKLLQFNKTDNVPEQ